jgi:hypothetical protein
MSEPQNATFLTEAVMAGGDWRALELAVSRLLLHCGWKNIQYVGESGDKGADVLAVRANPSKGTDDSYLIQVKAVNSNSYVGKSAVDQAVKGQAYYKAKVVVVATNGDFTKSAYDRRDDLNRQGYDVRLWNGKFLTDLVAKWPEYSEEKRSPREYQSKIVDSVVKGFHSGRRKALFVVATGLGKTVIASSVADLLYSTGLKKILVYVTLQTWLFNSNDLSGRRFPKTYQREYSWMESPLFLPTESTSGCIRPCLGISEESSRPLLISLS